jgi:hypothetical protein
MVAPWPDGSVTCIFSRKHLGIDKVKNVKLVLVVLPELVLVD